MLFQESQNSWSLRVPPPYLLSGFISSLPPWLATRLNITRLKSVSTWGSNLSNGLMSKLAFFSSPAFASLLARALLKARKILLRQVLCRLSRDNIGAIVVSLHMLQRALAVDLLLMTRLTTNYVGLLFSLLLSVYWFNGVLHVLHPLLLSVMDDHFLWLYSLLNILLALLCKNSLAWLDAPVNSDARISPTCVLISFLNYFCQHHSVDGDKFVNEIDVDGHRMGHGLYRSVRLRLPDL